jgi:RNA polymerase sigma-70 factor (ECF subfamily)
LNAKQQTCGEGGTDATPTTLGDLLYADQSKSCVSEAEWVALVRDIAEGRQRALQALYRRTRRLVFTLIMRITKDPFVAEELTLDVFHDVWRRAAKYDPAGGTVIGWIMNQARSRAVDRLRFNHRKKRVDPYPDDPSAVTVSPSSDHAFEAHEREQLLQTALMTLTADERRSIETVYFSELTYSQAATRLSQPTGTVKTRIRSGLQKLRSALSALSPKS